MTSNTAPATIDIQRNAKGYVDTQAIARTVAPEGSSAWTVSAIRASITAANEAGKSAYAHNRASLEVIELLFDRSLSEASANTRLTSPDKVTKNIRKTIQANFAPIAAAWRALGVAGFTDASAGKYARAYVALRIDLAIPKNDIAAYLNIDSDTPLGLSNLPVWVTELNKLNNSDEATDESTDEDTGEETHTVETREASPADVMAAAIQALNTIRQDGTVVTIPTELWNELAATITGLQAQRKEYAARH